MSGKESWPELVGKTKEEAEAQIKADRPDVQVQMVKANSPVTADYKPERVRIIFGDDGKVSSAPITG